MYASLYAALLFTIKHLIDVAALFSKKVKRWKSNHTQFEYAPIHSADSSELIWVHCASSGEYQQAKGLIDAYRTQKPESFFLISFFSDSGLFFPIDLEQCEIIAFPLDTSENINRIMDHYHPSQLWIMRTELWFNLLNVTLRRKLKVALIGAYFSETHWIRKWYALSYRRLLFQIDSISSQDEETIQWLKRNGKGQYLLTADVRLLSIKNDAQKLFNDSMVESFKNGQKLFIAGSIHTSDIQILQALRVSKLRTLIVPHQLSLTEKLKRIWPEAKILSQVESPSELSEASILIYDKIGVLRFLYRYADASYIGGGFGPGVHNIWEALVYGVNILVGPGYKKFPEVQKAVSAEIVYEVSLEDNAPSELLINDLCNDNKARRAHYFSEQCERIDDLITILKGN